MIELARTNDPAEGAVESDWLGVRVDPELARFGAWYEFFPRSAADQPGTHGTLDDAAARLPRIKDLGFDIVYLPPVHPIGTQFRKGKDNAPTAKPGEPGSPWAIGSEDGGHKAVAPELGGMEAFERFVAKADEVGLKVALDIAFQTSPDHPYVKEHPAWFRHRPDGTIRYAENPPKKYQDVYPLDFETEDWRALWDELKSVFEFWIEKGVRIFRVDNPHTKPFAFWEWCIGELRAEHPDLIFLAEAFAKPRTMYTLAKLGYNNSYTYFAWRNTKEELEEYGERAVPDRDRRVLPPELLAEHARHPHRLPRPRRAPGARRPVRPRRHDVVGLRALRAAVRARRGEPAPEAGGVQRQREVRGPPLELAGPDEPPAPPQARQPGPPREPRAPVHAQPPFPPDRQPAPPRLLQRGPARARRRETRRTSSSASSTSTRTTRRPAGSRSRSRRGASDEHRPFEVHDVLGGERYTWHGAGNYVELHPHTLPAHIFRIERRARTERDFEVRA